MGVNTSPPGKKGKGNKKGGLATNIMQNMVGGGAEEGGLLDN